MLQRGGIVVPIDSLVVLIVLVMEVQPKVRFAARSGDLEWNLRARPVLVKEGIDRLQQDRPPPGRHLRQLGIELQLAVKVERTSIEAVLPGHIGVRSGNLKMQK